MKITSIIIEMAASENVWFLVHTIKTIGFTSLRLVSCK